MRDQQTACVLIHIESTKQPNQSLERKSGETREWKSEIREKSVERSDCLIDRSPTKMKRNGRVDWGKQSSGETAALVMRVGSDLRLDFHLIKALSHLEKLQSYGDDQNTMETTGSLCPHTGYPTHCNQG